MSEISNFDDVIDSRDVIERITWLTDELADPDAWDADVIADMRDELDSLRVLAGEAEGYIADWQHGEALIRDSYFTDYAQQLADDIGAIDADATWPLNHIDWERAAEELRTDYTALDFGGVTYWAR